MPWDSCRTAFTSPSGTQRKACKVRPGTVDGTVKSIIWLDVYKRKEYEKRRLGIADGTKVKRISDIDVSAGYDIVSVNTPEAVVSNRFIAVSYKHLIF